MTSSSPKPDRAPPPPTAIDRADMEEDEEQQKIKKLKGKQVAEEDTNQMTWTPLLTQVKII